MSYRVHPGSILGRVGSEFGKGLAEQIPKEVERGRLASGLEALSQEQGLTPFQQLGRLATLPGVTPQLIQSGAELLKQQGRAGALKEKAGAAQALIDKANDAQRQVTQGVPGVAPSVTTTKGVEATTKPYIPKSFEQLQQRAGELLRDNPSLFQGDDAKAMQAAQAEDAQNQAISQAYQAQRSGEQNVQSRIENELSKHHERLGSNVPGNTYTDIENDAIEDVNSGLLTERAAAEKYGKKLDEISRDYKAVENMGDWGILTRSPQKNREQLKSLRDKFKKRGDVELENFANTMIAKNGLSPPKAFYMAYPVSDIKELNNEISRLPNIRPNFKKGYPEITNDIEGKTLKIAPKIAAAMGKEGSPLSIATELQARGYDPYTWIDYVDKNKDKLGLSVRQAREVSNYERDFTNTLNDAWMFIFSGLEKLVEQ